MNSDDTVLDKNIDNFQHIQVLSQNYPSGNQNPPMDCRAALQTATMVGFQAQWDGVQFCVDDFEIIPSTVVTPGNIMVFCVSWCAYQHMRIMRHMCLQRYIYAYQPCISPQIADMSLLQHC